MFIFCLCVINLFCVCVCLVVSQGPRGFTGVRGLKGEKGEVRMICTKGEAYSQLKDFFFFYIQILRLTQNGLTSKDRFYIIILHELLNAG